MSDDIWIKALYEAQKATYGQRKCEDCKHYKCVIVKVGEALDTVTTKAQPFNDAEWCKHYESTDAP